ncbi:uncharacterized protein BYT42DRAFT_587123 [Radiomyces spectabilis]|uniref:uncharacterized protein n=1 Tax=Radiomyces spectabilis TaxID=64574 RepID=UPI002220FB6D|nr:uncharacterized protein BYT42DRAFT_587123 [Radiomyces spectabilis]KAI8367688.1 hypothetical protein BYT42DRAFT_587123 [Radiomyces spectabilis]
MTRSATNAYVNRERRLSRNGLSDLRCPAKKAGAGFANWGAVGDELIDIQEAVLQNNNVDTVKPPEAKLQLVDQQTFDTRRSQSQ